MEETTIPNSGLMAKSPDRIQFGAGIICRGLKYESDSKKWNIPESIVGATSGGSHFEIIPEVTQVEIDGVYVPVMELDQKTGEIAKMETNFVELTPEIMKSALLATTGVSDIEGYSMITSKPSIEADDYWENIAFVGKTLTGKMIIVIIENALCTSGLAMDTKSKEGSVGKYTFEGRQKIGADVATLPYKIYYPTPSA